MKHIVSRMSSYFPNRWPLSYLNLTKNMKTHIRRQQHKKKFKHQDIKQKEPPQKHRPGTTSNTKLLAGPNWFYMAITSPSASAVVHNTQSARLGIPESVISDNQTCYSSTVGLDSEKRFCHKKRRNDTKRGTLPLNRVKIR